MSEEKIDPQTAQINEVQRQLLDLVGHPGWKFARQRLVDMVLELQNVSEYADIIQTGNATKLLKEMKANKRVAEILYSWLSEIEGTGQQAIENKPERRSYLHVIDEE